MPKTVISRTMNEFSGRASRAGLETLATPALWLYFGDPWSRGKHLEGWCYWFGSRKLRKLGKSL